LLATKLKVTPRVEAKPEGVYLDVQLSDGVSVTINDSVHAGRG